MLRRALHAKLGVTIMMRLAPWSGDGIKSADALRHAGVPADDAAVARQFADAESKLPRERLALFAKFEGMLMLDASGDHAQHPPMHQTQGQPAPAHGGSSPHGPN
jgi:hypothetical protein